MANASTEFFNVSLLPVLMLQKPLYGEANGLDGWLVCNRPMEVMRSPMLPQRIPDGSKKPPPLPLLRVVYCMGRNIELTGQKAGRYLQMLPQRAGLLLIQKLLFCHDSFSC